MHLVGAVVVGLLSICLSNVDAQVSVTTPTSTFWGSDGDEELAISVNVSSEAGWENVAVVVETPQMGAFDAQTLDMSDNSTWKLYTYTITSLYIDDAGSYQFTATDNTNPPATDASVDVFIYTVAVREEETQYYVVERTTELTVSTYVRTDGSWDNIEVTLTSPLGQDIAVTNQLSAALGPAWRYYTGTFNDITSGSYSFTATESLGEQSKSVGVTAKVEVNPTTNVDEYLRAIQMQTDDLSALVSDFYKYFYDGPDSTYVFDGGDDMYDRGNQLSIETSENEATMVPYGKPYEFESYQFSSVPTYPFTSLMWITNEDGTQNRFGYRVASQTGSESGQFSQSPSQTFQLNSYSMTYLTNQVYDSLPDPSICEVYFYVTNPDWSSVEPDNVTMDVAASPPTSLDNSFTLSGPVKNVMMGYTLLSRTEGQMVEDSDVRDILTEMGNIFSAKDDLSVSSPDDATLQPDQNSFTFTTRVTSSDWSTTTITLVTPGRGDIEFTEYTTEGDTRIYTYTINDLIASDSGVYTVRTVDGYGFIQESQTQLEVFIATLEADTTEFWGDKGEELTLTVRVTANDWADTSVMVTLPDGNVREATTTDTNDGERTYTYMVTNLFVEDAGDYSFYTSSNGIISSDDQKVTVYVFTIDSVPDSFQAHIAGQQDKATIMIYGVCDGNWQDVTVTVRRPTVGLPVEMEMESSNGSTPRIKVFFTEIEGATGGNYQISLTETLQGQQTERTATHHIEYHNGTVVDDYLYRIMTDADQLVGYVSNWHTYWYDGSDHTSIADGGDDMYNNGNLISLQWGTQLTADEIINQPYGEPIENSVFTYSSTNLYPFVSMMWIANNELVPQERFSLQVRGTSGADTDSYQRTRRTLVENTYTVTYETFQVLRRKGPTICEVYFVITNPYYWNSVEPKTFNVSVGSTPPQFLENTVTVTGSPKNVMLGYTLLSSSTGEEIPYLEVDLVLENFVSRIAEKDQFLISPVNDDGVSVVTPGEDVTIEISVQTSGQWDGVSVQVVTPSGSKQTVTKYRYSNLNIERIYEYELKGAMYDDDNGDYQAIATDSFDTEVKTTFTVHVFTASMTVNAEQYVGTPGQAATMSIEVTSRMWSAISVQVDTPTQGKMPVTIWSMSQNDPSVRTYEYTVSDIAFGRDQGQYVFTVTELAYEKYDFTVTDSAILEVFSVAIEPAANVYTAEEGQAILQISATVSAMSSPYDVSVSIQTPGRGTVELPGFNVLGDNRLYEYTMRDVTLEDAGEYVFVATQTIQGQTYTVESAGVVVIVKAKESEIPSEKLSGGEIAGIVIGSIAAALVFMGFGCLMASRSKPKQAPVSEPTKSKIGHDNKAAEMDDKAEVEKKAEEKANAQDLENAYSTCL